MGGDGSGQTRSGGRYEAIAGGYLVGHIFRDDILDVLGNPARNSGPYRGDRGDVRYCGTCQYMARQLDISAAKPSPAKTLKYRHSGTIVLDIP